ncbi:sodium:solute symporter family protein [Cerasicoccus arenae]|uniref:Cation acetate symporter n=1 Tax=Cerasicoccus arenae TaxID=424488 RepID=A0A8J3DB08_9BACT|nr:sodium:solute symporter family protein [Cerasicoccus arenae]MBK1856757.1 cation acetate symporter [Cerasicoccus arenae]GHB99305.1 cation acetate symporter [Cerasicoccus arenae]
MSVLAWTYLFVGLSFTLYLGIAWWARVADTKGFYVAGQGVPAAANGMATAADWMSAASFISMAGLISTMGYSGGVYLMGWTGGYVLLALLIAPYLRKFGHYTVPDFVGDRFGTKRSQGAQNTVIQRILANPARVVAVVCALFVSFTYVAGQMRGVGVVFSRFLEVDVNVGVIIGMVIVFIYSTLGGMKGITWTQVAQFWVLITAFLVPSIAISIQLTGSAIPQVGLGSEIVGSGMMLLDKLDGIHKELGFTSYTEPFQGGWDKLNVFMVTLALMAGTAGLPHVIVRFYTVKSPAAARWSAFWALLFISGLYLTAPALAGFARYYMINTLNGASQEEIPEWFNNWKKTGLILWLDGGDGKLHFSNNADNEIFRQGTLSADDFGSIVQQHQLWLDTKDTATPKGMDGRTILRDKGLSGPDKDIIVLATPEMASLSNWIIAFVAAGGLAAALSTASGLLLVISSSVAHDLYYRILNPKASDKQRLAIGRGIIGLAVVVAGIFGIYPPGFVAKVVAFAFGLAAASFFPIIILGIFNRRVGTTPAVFGMLSGLGVTLFYIIGTVYFGMPEWTLFGLTEKGIKPEAIGCIGMLINFAVALGLAPFCERPGPHIQALIDSVREPEDSLAPTNIDEAPEH